jgi:hypothetical protein
MRRIAGFVRLADRVPRELVDDEDLPRHLVPRDHRLVGLRRPYGIIDKIHVLLCSTWIE